MSIYHGKNVRLYIAGYDISALASSVGVSGEMEMAQYAVADGVDGYHQLPGLARGRLNLEGLFDDNYMSVLNNLWASDTGYQVMVLFGTSQGDRAVCVNSARLGPYEWKSVVTDVNRLTGQLVTDSIGWEECKLIQPKAQKTSDGNGTSLDNGTASSDGLTAYLQVFECGGDDDLIVKIQESSDDGATDPWADKITFTTATGITAERKTVSGSIERYLRVTWSGTSPYQATFAVAIKR